MSYHTEVNTVTLTLTLSAIFSKQVFPSTCETVPEFAVQHCNQPPNCQDFDVSLKQNVIAFRWYQKLLF